jgi:WD40 repeat protein
VKSNFFVAFVLTLGVTILIAQEIPFSPEVIETPTVHLREIASLPTVLKEASGLEITGSGLLWTHNDERFSLLYGMDTLGNIIKTVHLNHPNDGWEDLARDEKGNVYIGSFGNNKNERKNLRIYKLTDPERITETVSNAGVIKYHYADQHAFPPSQGSKNFDVDAFVSLGDSLYLFTKNRTQPFTGYSKVYRLPQEPGEYEAVLYDSIYLGDGPMIDYWVTSADVSPDGKWLALLSHDCIWIIPRLENRRFSSCDIFKIDLKNFSHKAGLCFSTNTKIYIVDELEMGFLGGKIYSMDLSSVFGHIQRRTAAYQKRPRKNGLTGE